MPDITISIDLEELESDIESHVQSAVESAVSDADFSDLDFREAVREASYEADFSDAVESAVRDADFSGPAQDAVQDAVEDIDLAPAMLRALKDATVRAQFEDFVAHAIKRSMAINFGLVTAETHQDELEGLKAENEELAKAAQQVNTEKDEEIQRLQRELNALRSANVEANHEGDDSDENATESYLASTGSIPE